MQAGQLSTASLLGSPGRPGPERDFPDPGLLLYLQTDRQTDSEDRLDLQTDGCSRFARVNQVYRVQVYRVQVLRSPSGVHPGLVPVVLLRVVEQLLIGRNGPLSPLPACGTAWVGGGGKSTSC